MIHVKYLRDTENKQTDQIMSLVLVGTFFSKDVWEWFSVALNRIHLWGVWICNYIFLYIVL